MVGLVPAVTFCAIHGGVGGDDQFLDEAAMISGR
jgi:hypothetical protein